MRPIVLVVLSAALLAGCAGNPTPPETPESPPVTAPAAPGAAGESQALGLVGLWRVSGAANEQPDAWLRLDAVEFQLWRDCGMIMGSWTAGEAAFIASTHSASGACVEDEMPTVAWLESATAFERAGDGWQLTDAAGTVVASLAVDGAPEPIDTAADFYAQPPELTEETYAAFRRSAPLPAALEAATAESLAGLWVPIEFTGATDPHVDFAADGSWEGSDGCNGAAGRWSSGFAGEFFATLGPSTLMGCEGAPVPVWIAGARIAGFDGDQLLLLDRDGNELGRLVRA
jgi:hypothetical protein